MSTSLDVLTKELDNLKLPDLQTTEAKKEVDESNKFAMWAVYRKPDIPLDGTVPFKEACILLECTTSMGETYKTMQDFFKKEFGVEENYKLAMTWWTWSGDQTKLHPNELDIPSKVTFAEALSLMKDVGAKQAWAYPKIYMEKVLMGTKNVSEEKPEIEARFDHSGLGDKDRPEKVEPEINVLMNKLERIRAFGIPKKAAQA